MYTINLLLLKIFITFLGNLIFYNSDHEYRNDPTIKFISMWTYIYFLKK